MERSGLRDDPIVPLAGTRAEGHALGIDVGGTGVKAAVVDLATGHLLTDQIEEKTPHPATPGAVVEAIAHVLRELEVSGELQPDMAAACGLPGVVKFGRLMTAANLDKSWVEAPAEELMAERLGRPVLAINDADAAGLAEMTYGAGAGNEGTVLFVGIGTGIGSALFIQSQLVPNCEFGHIELYGQDAETLVSGASRERRGLGWKEWAADFNAYLAHMELYLWPDLVIIGGGVSRAWAEYERYLESRAPLVTARLLNTAGVVGAALAGANAQQQRSELEGKPSQAARGAALAG
ncbi:MAG: ROK family protein [Chloroflexota bacterium]|nr:ROK family protein [Chloroflexota bacterium]